MLNDVKPLFCVCVSVCEENVVTDGRLSVRRRGCLIRRQGERQLAPTPTCSGSVWYRGVFSRFQSPSISQLINVHSVWISLLTQISFSLSFFLVVFFPCFLSIPQSAPDSWWTNLPLPWPVPLLPPLLLALFPMHRQRGSAKVGSVNFLLQTLIAFGCWRGRKFFRCLKPPPEGRNVAAGLWM